VSKDILLVYVVLFKMPFRKRLNQDVNRHVTDFFSSGKYVVSGNHDGTVNVWDTCASSDVILPCHMTYVAHNDCVNGIRYSVFSNCESFYILHVFV
jgi:WD40 repeat protein